MAEWVDFQERSASLTNYLESKSMEAQCMRRLVMEAAQLGKELCAARKEIYSRGAKSAALKEDEEDDTLIKKEVTK